MLSTGENRKTEAKTALSFAPEGYLPLDDPRYHPAWQGVAPLDCNLVLEGGSMRGQFTAGVLDLLMDEGILPSTVIGVSAGALNGCNFVAGMRGRTSYLNTKYCDYWRYYSMRSLLLKGSVSDMRFVFGDLLYGLEPFDFDSFADSPLRLITVAANLETGQADYHEYRDLRSEMGYLQASVSMPLVTRPVTIDGKKLLDGGICDSVPIEHSKGLGANRHIVVLTQDADYIKQPVGLRGLSRLMYRRYARFIWAIEHRHEIYNQTYAQVTRMHEDGEIFLLRPQHPVTVASMEQDRGKLRDLYLHGYGEAKRHLPAIRAYLA